MSPVVHLMDLDEVPYGLCSPVHAGGEQGTPRLVQSPRARIYSIPLDQVVDGVVVSVFGRDDDVVNLANGHGASESVRACSVRGGASLRCPYRGFDLAT